MLWGLLGLFLLVALLRGVTARLVSRFSRVSPGRWLPSVRLLARLRSLLLLTGCILSGLFLLFLRLGLIEFNASAGFLGGILRLGRLLIVSLIRLVCVLRARLRPIPLRRQRLLELLQIFICFGQRRILRLGAVALVARTLVLTAVAAKEFEIKRENLRH